MLPNGSRTSIDAAHFRWLAGAVVVALILPRIWQRGMFLDGITYAVVARNMASGAGTFWRPSFSDTVYATFFEQPPLGMGLQALAFRLFGDHLFVERVFSVAVFTLTALCIVAIWRKLLPAQYDWLPLFFWVLPSVVTWAVINNMLENTQALFTTFAVLAIVSCRGARSVRVRGAWIAAAGGSVVAAFLTKGPVGLFPLAVPPLLAVLGPIRRDSVARAAAIWLLLLLVAGGAGAVLLASDAARTSIAEFSRTHLVPALEGHRGAAARSIDVARHLTLGVWARMAAGIGLLWAIRPRNRRTARGDAVPSFLFFVLVGLTGSLPILISPVLAGHYFLPSIPFFALAAAAISLPAVQAFHAPRPHGFRRFIPAGLAAALVTASVLVLLVRGPMERRDGDRLAGFDAIGPVAPVGRTIGSCSSAAADWGLLSYLQRFFRISVEANDAPAGGWFLIANGSCAAPAGCHKRAGTGSIELYACPAVPPALTKKPL